MSETTTEQTGQENEQTGQENAEGQETTGQETTGQSPDGEKPAEKKTTREKAPDTSKITADAINAAALAIPDLVAASAPIRERSAEQKVMDEVAKRAYRAWVDAGRPTLWQKIPVVTYFLNEDEVRGYQYLIRRACAIVDADTTGITDEKKKPTGVRVRFGNQFTLSEEMAKKVKVPGRDEVGAPELAGKIVLAWAAIDKRPHESDGEKPTGHRTEEQKQARSDAAKERVAGRKR
jgi:hypothetical protein